MSPVIKASWSRAAELWTLSGCDTSKMSEKHRNEFEDIMKLNQIYCYRMARLENLSMIATQLDDITLQHSICAAIDELEATGTTTFQL